MKLLPLLLVALCGCTSAIKALKEPPHPYAVIHHTRAVGIEATVPSQTGDSIVKLRLGWFSDTISLIPSTVDKDGKMSTAQISDDFKLDNTVSFSPSTKIIESLTTGWTGSPPPARYTHLFSTNPPAIKPVTP